MSCTKRTHHRACTVTNSIPRSPMGERRWFLHFREGHLSFNPRSPWGGATNSMGIMVMGILISIHAPCGGSDPPPFYCLKASSNFNPRSPWGERQQRCTKSLSIFGEGEQISRKMLQRVGFAQWPGVGLGRCFWVGGGANLAGKSVGLDFAVRSSGCPPAGRCSCSRSAPPSFRSCSPDSRSEGCPFPGP